MTPPIRLQFGSVILAEVFEPGGKAAGPHPAVVLNRQAEIDAGLDLWVAVCPTSFGYPLPSGWFDMPSQPGGHPVTGLTEACVVKATWLQSVPQSAVLKVHGRAPIAIVKQIVAWLRDQKLLP